MEEKIKKVEEMAVSGELGKGNADADDDDEGEDAELNLDSPDSPRKKKKAGVVKAVDSEDER